MGRRAAGRRSVTTAADTPHLAYFWGQDAYGLERAASELGRELSEAAGQPLEIWRTSGDDDDGAASAGATDGAGKRRARLLDEIELRIATAPLFGAGMLVVVRQPQALAREQAARERLTGLLTAVAPGNALCFVDLLASGGKAPAQSGTLRELVAAAGGQTREFPSLTRERMEAFLNNRAAELEVKLAPGVSRLLAERVGAYVREGDVDRRRQTELANAELEKLALYRPNGTISRDDIEALVGEAVPVSAWALGDAVGTRRPGEAARLAEGLLDAGTAMAVLIAQLHRRLRELIVIADHLAAGTKPAELVRELRLQPFRAQKLTEQARRWSAGELDAALAALFEIDLLSKGIAPDGGPHSLSEDRTRLALTAWFAQHVARRG